MQKKRGQDQKKISLNISSPNNIEPRFYEITHTPQITTMASLKKIWKHTSKSTNKPIKFPEISNFKRQIETGDTTT